MHHNPLVGVPTAQFYAAGQSCELVRLADHSRTDKNTSHSYLPLYQRLLESKKNTAKRVLEVGIAKGGSIKLWHDFFPNATVYGLDIIGASSVWGTLHNNSRIQLYTSYNAYDERLFASTFLAKGEQFDFMLDDGPHDLESMIQFIRLYSLLMTDDGILIIEDVQAWEWIATLIDAVPEHLKNFVRVYDLRPLKNRWDDIVFTIDKSIIP